MYNECTDRYSRQITFVNINSVEFGTKIKRLRYTEQYFCLLFGMGVNFGRSH